MNDQAFKQLKSSPISLKFIETLNSYRTALTEEFKIEEMSRETLTDVLLNLQMDIYDNNSCFDIETLQQQNLQNLVTLLQFSNSEKESEQNQELFDLDWQEQDEIENAQLQIKKQNSGKQTEYANTFTEQKPQRKMPSIFQNKLLKVRSEKRENEFASQQDSHKSASVDFVSAKVLPKGTSVRKKFVPPFKKNPIQTINQSENEEEGAGTKKDPQYKNLDEKLVQAIESEILETKKSVKWEDIAGLQFAKKMINEMIVWPMMRPDIFTGMRAPPRGILLFGPPGTGKTMIGRAIASSASATFFNISASSLTSKWVGQSEKLVKTLFHIARIKQPSVIFIDEIDSLLCARSEGEQESSRRVKTEFLVELDGAKTSGSERILIIGATNLPQELDDAVRRRFVKRLYIPLPNRSGRTQLIRHLTSNGTFSIKEGDVETLAALCKGFSGADIYTLCQEASMAPLREMDSIENIRQSEVPKAHLPHFEEALKFVRPSVSQTALSKYIDWNEQFGSYQFGTEETST